MAKKSLKVQKSAHSQGLALGDTVPSMALPMTGGGTLKLGKSMDSAVVLYFYPKDATPGCTLEGHEFSHLKSKFEALGYQVYGVSRDSMTSHEKFKAKQKYTVDLLSDEGSELCTAFGVIKEKNMYGKKVMGIERSTFVISTNGKIIGEWRKVKAEGHAQAVLTELKKL